VNGAGSLAIAALIVVGGVPLAGLVSFPSQVVGLGSNLAPVGEATGEVPSLGSTSWPAYMDNVERTGANLAEATIGPSNVAELAPVWSVSDNGSDFSAPIVVNGTVYYGSWNGYEEAVNAANGAVEWRTFLGVDTACGGYDPMGISSTPAYAGGTLYLGGGDGYWYALNAATGATEWRYLAGSEADGYYNWASAVVYGASLYVGTSSCFDSPLVPAGLLELNLTGPHTVSHVFNSTPPGMTGVSIWTTPAIDPVANEIWLSTGNENPPGYPIYANAIVGLNATTLNVTGSWQVPNVAGQDSDFGSTPTLFRTAAGAPMVVATNKNGVAYALDRGNVSRSGSWAPTWNLTTGGGFSGGAFDGQTLYLAGGSSISAVDPANGSVLWTSGMVGGGAVTGSLAWANGLVYATGGSVVEAIDSANGTVLWNYSLPSGQSSVTEPVIEDGRLYVTSGDYGTHGSLTAFALPPPKGPPGSSWVLIGLVAVAMISGAVILIVVRRRSPPPAPGH
jgi:outer membrane protein assembly factor BamB